MVTIYQRRRRQGFQLEQSLNKVYSGAPGFNTHTTGLINRHEPDSATQRISEPRTSVQLNTVSSSEANATNIHWGLLYDDVLESKFDIIFESDMFCSPCLRPKLELVTQFAEINPDPKCLCIMYLIPVRIMAKSTEFRIKSTNKTQS